MEAKLIKKNDIFYLYVDESWSIASTDVKDNRDKKLSLKNCQEIERGYDLDELAENKWNELSKQLGLSIQDKAMWCGGFKHGLLEILSDNKYSEEDVKKAFEMGEDFGSLPFSSYTTSKRLNKKEYIQSLQQTEWDVEIVMEDSITLDGHTIIGKEPKLDADGCLILKRKS